MDALAVSDIWKYYGDFPALRGIGFTVAPGRCVALLGRNGAGKTTLLRILAGLSRPSKGGVVVFGADAKADATRRGIGLIGHGIGIYDELSAIENLKLFAGLYGLPHPNAAAAEWLERTGLANVQHSLVREFSRGMRQRLAVARAFLHAPRLLLLDEPFTALDDRAITLLQGLLRDALAKGSTVVMSTHQLREALELASDVVLINRGKVGHSGPRTQQMVDDPGYLYRTYGEA